MKTTFDEEIVELGKECQKKGLPLDPIIIYNMWNERHQKPKLSVSYIAMILEKYFLDFRKLNNSSGPKKPKQVSDEKSVSARLNSNNNNYDDDIIYLRNKGLNYREIADYFTKIIGLQATRGTVSKKCIELKVNSIDSRHVDTSSIEYECGDLSFEEFEAQIKKLNKANYRKNRKEILEKYVLLADKRRKLIFEKGRANFNTNCKPHLKVYSREFEKEIRFLRESGLFYSEIADYFKRIRGIETSEGTVYKICRKIGIKNIDSSQINLSDIKDEWNNLSLEELQRLIERLKSEESDKDELLKAYVLLTEKRRSLKNKRKSNLNNNKNSRESDKKPRLKKYDKQFDKDIAYLKRKGLFTYEILGYLELLGIEATYFTVREICQRLNLNNNLRNIDISDIGNKGDLSIEQLENLTIELKSKEDRKEVLEAYVLLTEKRRKSRDTITSDKVLELYQKGKKPIEIEQLLHVTRSRIYDIINKSGVKNDDKEYLRRNSIRCDNIVREARKSGLTYEEISKFLDSIGIRASVSTVRKKCILLRLEKGHLDVSSGDPTYTSLQEINSRFEKLFIEKKKLEDLIREFKLLTQAKRQLEKQL